jgi:hypothetical protein
MYQRTNNKPTTTPVQSVSGLRVGFVVLLVVCWLATAVFGSGAALASARTHAAVGAGTPAAVAVVRAASGGAVAEAPLPDGKGFWSVTAAGAVTPYGAAPYEGGLAGVALNAPVLSIASTPDGRGYWMVAADGGIFSFGDARFYGSTGNVHLDQPIVGMASTPDGRGYWMVAADGGIFSFGDARFYGSTGNVHLDQPIVGMAPAGGGHGYWLVASDGGIFSFGDARFYGSTGNVHLDKPIVGMAPTAGGLGYWLAASDGGIFTFGDAQYYGSGSGRLDGGSAVGMIATTGGYWLATTTGAVLAFGAALVLNQPAAQTTSPAVGPLTNISPSASFAQACYAVSSASCNSWALQAIDAAHTAEGLAPLQLPSDYSALNPAEQLVAVTNAERQARGLPAFAGPVAALDVLALQASETENDPTGPAGSDWVSNWGYGFATPLAIDFVWMYDDGPGSDNVDCTPTNQSGCWGHRHNILVPWGGIMGAADLTVGAGNSISELLVAG